MNKKPLYIVLAGKKQVGKDTIGKIIEKLSLNDGYKPTRTSFAEPLKRFCSDIFGISPELMDTEEGKKLFCDIKWDELQRVPVVQDGYMEKHGNLTIRELLQYLGSNILRNRFYSKIWAQAPFRKKYSENNDIVIITDCRFKNELEESNKNNAIVFYIKRDTKLVDNHISEKDLDDVNWKQSELIINNSSIEELEKNITEIYNSIIRPQLIYANISF